MVFENVLSMVNPPTVLKRTWLVEWFYGSDLKSLWDQNVITGTATFGMQDDVDEGFFIAPAAGGSASRSSIIVANSERHFDPRACVMDGIARRFTVSGIYAMGFGNRTDGDLGNTPDEAFFIQNRSATSVQRLATINGVSSTVTSTTVLEDELFHRSRLEINATSALLSMDGILEATSVTTLPDSASKLYAGFKAQNLLAVTSESRIRYMEAFNT